ncbi:MAG: hypothetical protein HXX14_03875 [Bacteroidetes bacterium]|nr:hypothetical protein [Bacteroidota bacterium]
MKSNIKIVAILLTMITSFVVMPKQVSAQQAGVSFQVFYDQLSPYGQWVDYPNYGYVWIPDVGTEFVPYSTAGHWILTDDGWTWVSDYDWGWAPFHYGRWDYDNNYGWFWVPDTIWGPSWVNWRSAEGYYGWSPMRPGISLSISFGNNYDRRNDHWTFVRDRDFDRPDINRYYINHFDHDQIIRNSTVINQTYFDNSRHTTYVYGPKREDVQRFSGRSIRPVSIQENNKPGQSVNNGQLRIYRPDIKKNNDRDQKPVPSRLIDLKDVKHPSGRNGSDQPRNNNPSNNNIRVQQPNTVIPQNNINVVRPVQPQNTNPTQDNRRVQQPRFVQPQNNNNNVVRPVQPQNTNPTQDNRRVQQPRFVQPQNNNNNVARPVQPQNANPTQDNRRVQQPRSVQPQNSNNNVVRPAQPQNANPVPNNNRVQQPRSVQPQNNNNTVKPSQPQRVNQPQNNKREQQPKTVGPSNNNRKEQLKAPKKEEEKK